MLIVKAHVMMLAICWLLLHNSAFVCATDSTHMVEEDAGPSMAELWAEADAQQAKQKEVLAAKRDKTLQEQLQQTRELDNFSQHFISPRQQLLSPITSTMTKKPVSATAATATPTKKTILGTQAKAKEDLMLRDRILKREKEAKAKEEKEKAKLQAESDSIVAVPETDKTTDKQTKKKLKQEEEDLKRKQQEIAATDAVSRNQITQNHKSTIFDVLSMAASTVHTIIRPFTTLPFIEAGLALLIFTEMVTGINIIALLGYFFLLIGL
eukprot:c8658_g1_i1.p1 GENE.c8658_g1_i1~~c8658_g1_i1.p1  ORF type:complete len:267 (+),score=88.47 c8658_g1_i1:153-953(+)